jgi:hypothetical protein
VLDCVAAGTSPPNRADKQIKFGDGGEIKNEQNVGQNRKTEMYQESRDSVIKFKYL